MATPFSLEEHGVVSSGPSLARSRASRGRSRGVVGGGDPHKPVLADAIELDPLADPVSAFVSQEDVEGGSGMTRFAELVDGLVAFGIRFHDVFEKM